ncbi:TPA: SirB2 family protein [Mannheimia haemolytica]|uniref:Invasion gene expression up-regulator, SirB n=1 Tax=Mannheimia haemolytica TaxID=75985 RepID=A0A249A0I9_MANHA|nr:SirB2 family protein [Mannheimia haemolytica]AWW71602.1 invasion protein expression up-regulator SirB [Pasteurellaceae bacterium 12565]AGI32811.1 invasion protein expression up-regulator SirB [Mannheimia haemolytica USDA-ARS-USMARC-183]AGI35219.1 invasion protein expression up-regulator SirB [Mannheimia haemolytica USDA-ARS-USMARC-185]AGK02591.1 SirB-like protein [Mannheimia haemolytica M42548]AGQ24566.1 invasion protein expression up-regulator SirB [Mannheimia haemolytica D153]
MEYLSTILKAHIGLAYISLILLLTRGFLSSKMVDWRQYKILRIAPHAVDTFLLITGIAAVAIFLAYDFFTLAQFSWLLPKLLFLVLYIVFATKAFKKGQPFSLKFYLLAVVSFLLMMLTATFH